MQNYPVPRERDEFDWLDLLHGALGPGLASIHVQTKKGVVGGFLELQLFIFSNFTQSLQVLHLQPIIPENMWIG